MYKIILADGTEIFTGGGGENGSRLWIFGLHMTIQEAMSIFSDPSKTNHIKIIYPIPPDMEYDGYTTLTAVVNEDGETRVRLEK